MTTSSSNNKFYTQIVDILHSAKNQVVKSVNQTMVLAYFEIGRMLVEEEQGGKERAEYGKELLKGLSDLLKKEFGRGFSVTNLKQMRNFYLIYGKGQTVSDLSDINPSALLTNSKDQTKTVHAEASRKVKQEKFVLSWSHYLKLMRIDDENERSFMS